MNTDPSIFDAPITPQERTDFRTQFYPAFAPSRAIFTAAVALLVSVGVLIYGSVSTSNFNEVLRVFGLLAAIVAFGQLIARLNDVVQFKVRLNTSIKAYRFAVSNNLNYEAEIQRPARNGFIFQNPRAQKSTILDLISNTGEYPFEIGSYSYETSSGKSKIIHKYSFMSIPLDRHLPHMVLDTTADDTKFFGVRQSNLGMSFTEDQVLRLEGNFNDYFTLYAPKEYETDALYVFTPDLMARLIDEASSFNAEIIDNDLYIYSIESMPLDRPETYQRFLKIFETVGPKALKQTRNYRDARSQVSGAVDVTGQRLKKGLSVTTSVVLTVVVILYLIQIILPVVDSFAK